MDIKIYLCAGCNTAYTKHETSESCESCGAKYRFECLQCEKLNDQKWNIFYWDEKEQCRKCTTLHSKTSIEDSKVLTWFVHKHGINVEDVKNEYKLMMLKSGLIINDSVCGRCKEECQHLWEETKADDYFGVCCLCLKLKYEEWYCECCKERQPENIPESGLALSTITSLMKTEG